MAQVKKGPVKTTEKKEEAKPADSAETPQAETVPKEEYDKLAELLKQQGEQIKSLQEKQTVKASGGFDPEAFTESLTNALVSAEQKKGKTEDQRRSDQVNKLAELQRQQLEDLQTPEDKPVGYEWIEASQNPKVKIKSTEKHLMHIQVSKKEHDPIKKTYVENKKLIYVYPSLYANQVIAGKFKEFDNAAIVHDPRTKEQRDSLVAAQEKKKRSEQLVTQN